MPANLMTTEELKVKAREEAVKFFQEHDHWTLSQHEMRERLAASILTYIERIEKLEEGLKPFAEGK